MRPQMMEALYKISLLTAPDPETVFQQILEVVAELYGNTMAMVNVQEGDCLRYRAVVNPHPAFQSVTTLNLQQTLCQVPMASSRPLLIQNARRHPDFRRHIVVALKLNRYLGVPIYSSTGSVVGTLCFLDNQTEEMLGEEDIRFLSMLAMRVSAGHLAQPAGSGYSVSTGISPVSCRRGVASCRTRTMKRWFRRCCKPPTTASW